MCVLEGESECCVTHGVCVAVWEAGGADRLETDLPPRVSSGPVPAPVPALVPAAPDAADNTAAAAEDVPPDSFGADSDAADDVGAEASSPGQRKTEMLAPPLTQHTVSTR